MDKVNQRRTVAYLRVSTSDQDIEKNKSDILFFANDKNLGKVSFLEDKSSGVINWRKRLLGELIESLNKDDNLIISEFSRLGRSMLECIEIISICLSKKINLYAVKGSWQLDNSIQSKVMAMMFSIVSEIERDLISKRTTEALKARKEKGLPLGRPKGKGKSKLDSYEDEIYALLNNGSTYTFVARKYNTTPSNLKHWLDKRSFTKGN